MKGWPFELGEKAEEEEADYGFTDEEDNNPLNEAFQLTPERTRSRTPRRDETGLSGVPTPARASIPP